MPSWVSWGRFTTRHHDFSTTPNSFAALVSGADEAFDVVHRALLLSMLVPIVLNAIGFLWPLLHISSYERNAKAFQRITLSAAVLARLFQSANSQSWMPHRDIKQSLVFDAFTLIINQVKHASTKWNLGHPLTTRNFLPQDPTEELLLQLALLQLLYNVGHFIVAPAAATGGASHLAAVTQCEFFVTILMLVIPVHR